MASEEILPISAQQPSEGDQLHEIMDLISATHIVPADEKIDVDSRFVVVKNILRRSTHIVDNVLQGKEHLENLEEKVSRAMLLPFAKNINGTCEKLKATIGKAGYKINRQQKRWTPHQQSPNEKLQLKRMWQVIKPRGPYEIEDYTFFCGGKDNKWIEQFSKKVNVVDEDPITKAAYIFIELSCVGKSRKQLQFWKRTKTRKKTDQFDLGNQEIQKLLHSFKNESRWAVLTKGSTRVVCNHGMTIMKVLEAFEEWKVNVRERGFEICFKEYYDKFLPSGLLPLTS